MLSNKNYLDNPKYKSPDPQRLAPPLMGKEMKTIVYGNRVGGLIGNRDSVISPKTDIERDDTNNTFLDDKSVINPQPCTTQNSIKIPNTTKQADQASAHSRHSRHSRLSHQSIKSTNPNILE